MARVAFWLLGALVSAGCGRLDFDLQDGGGTGNEDADCRCDAGPPTPAAPWQLVQVNGFFSASGGPSISVGLMAVAAGDLVVVGCHVDSSALVVGVQDDASGGTNTYVEIPTSLATNTTAGDRLELWYAVNAHAGATTVTVTSSNNAYTVVAWEFTTSHAATIDTAGQLSEQASTTTPLGPAIATHQAGELVVAATLANGSVTAIHPGNEFTNDSLTNMNGWAHITATDVPAGTQQAEWDSTAGTYCSSAAAFYVGP